MAGTASGHDGKIHINKRITSMDLSLSDKHRAL
jgi:hypothetical protein